MGNVVSQNGYDMVDGSDSSQENGGRKEWVQSKSVVTHMRLMRRPILWRLIISICYATLRRRRKRRVVEIK